MENWQEISRQITTASGQEFHLKSAVPIAGGCINTAYLIQSERHQWFVKLNQSDKLPMFEAEAAGLKEILKSSSVRTPIPLCTGLSGHQSFLVMEYIPLVNTSDTCAKILGEQLAWMHRVENGQFGWSIDNTIGSTEQINLPSDNWVEFWCLHRISYQLALAANNGYSGTLLTRGERLMEVIPEFFTTYSPPASLLHGDLWSGNYGTDQTGNPVIFDPAVYYGDRETDLAMTELFGGFPLSFYSAYREAYPTNEGYTTRKILYNLYHILNHLNLFGRSYQGQAEAMINKLISEV